MNQRFPKLVIQKSKLLIYIQTQKQRQNSIRSFAIVYSIFKKIATRIIKEIQLRISNVKL